MGYAFGLAPKKVGEQPAPATIDLLEGTSADDLQRVIGSWYIASGIEPDGGAVVTGTSGWGYAVTSGVAIMWTSSAERRAVEVPFSAVTVSTDPAPSTGSRIDTLYVGTDGAVRVGIGQSTAPSGVVLDKREVRAGAANTLASVSVHDQEYAIRTGASIGLLHRFHDPANGIFGNVSPMTLGAGRFFLKSDRRVRFDLTWCSSGEGQGEGVAGWAVFVDGKQEFARNWKYSGNFPDTHFQSVTMNLTAGAHTVHYVQKRQQGARFYHHKGGPDGHLGNRFEVWDAGVAR